MKLSRATIDELGIILKEEFKIELNPKDLERLANLLVGYFSLLVKIENRHKFGNSSNPAIDSRTKHRLDRKR